MAGGMIRISAAGAALGCAVLLMGNAARAQTASELGTPGPSTHVPAHLPPKPRHKAPAHPPVLAPRHGTIKRKAPAPAPHKTPPGYAPAPAHPRKPPVQAVPAPPPPPPPAAPPAPKPPEKGGNSGLPLPRFAALKSDDVNLRAGPGDRYPVEWVYQRRDLPVEIEHEFDVWRQVEDMDGVKGWVHQATLSGRRTVVVTGAARTMRAEPREDAAAVAVLKPGVVARLKRCDAASDWCQVQVQSYAGYLKRDEFWGTLPNEAVQP
jgi:SH3-like domain-containing protein